MSVQKIPMNSAVEALVAAGFNSAQNSSVAQVQEQLNKLDTVITPEYVDQLEGKPKKLLKRVMSVLETGQFTVIEAPSEGDAEVSAPTKKPKKAKPAEADAEPSAPTKRVKKAKPTEVEPGNVPKRVKKAKPTEVEAEQPKPKKAKPAEVKPEGVPKKVKKAKPAEVEATTETKKPKKSTRTSSGSTATGELSQAKQIEATIASSFKRRPFKARELFDSLSEFRPGRIRDHLTTLIRKGILERQTDGEYRVSVSGKSKLA